MPDTVMANTVIPNLARLHPMDFVTVRPYRSRRSILGLKKIKKPA
jgi:hypothetical protein